MLQQHAIVLIGVAQTLGMLLNAVPAACDITVTTIRRFGTQRQLGFAAHFVQIIQRRQQRAFIFCNALQQVA